MELNLSIAKEADATRIADIHMAAFQSNRMLLAQFPTPAVRDGLWTSLVQKVTAEMKDPQWAVLVVRDPKQQNKVVSFAKWCLPIPESKNYEEAPWRWPEGTDMAVLDEWTEKVETAGERILGRTPIYRLSFIATDPQYQRCGAASLLIQWGLERSRKERILAALEGTTDAAPLYERLGFKAEEEISMRLDGVGQDGTNSVLYKEKCFIFRPS